MGTANPPKTATFPRAARLTAAAEFQQVFRHGKCLQLSCLGARIHPNALGEPRLGIAIAKKAVRRAHERNRLRRLIRESFRQHRSLLPAVDVVLLCRPEAAALGNAEIFRQLQGLWLRVCKLYSAGFGQPEAAPQPDPN